MTNITEMIDRNSAFADSDARKRLPAIPFIPNRQLYVITCVDPRVDPADILDLQLGDAIVGRSIGGRITPSVLQDIAWISYLHETKTPDADWFDVVVIHHTDCGSGFFADDELRHGFVERGFSDTETKALAVLDPSSTVRDDAHLLINYPALSPQVRVSGYSYDTESGLLTEVVPPTSRSEQLSR